MLELLPLAALRLIFNRSVVTTTSLEMPLGHTLSQPQRVDCCSDTHTSPHTLSGRFLLFVPMDSYQPSSDSVMFRHHSESHSGAGEMMRPEPSSPA